MLVTHQSKEMHARPMAIARLDKGMDAYLITDTDFVKVDEIDKRSPCSAYCSKREVHAKWVLSDGLRLANNY